MGTPGVPSCHLLSCGLELLNKCNDRRPSNHDKLYEESDDRREQTGFGKAVVCDPRPWLDIWTGCRRISVCTPASQGGVCHGFAFRCRSNPPFCLNVASEVVENGLPATRVKTRGMASPPLHFVHRAEALEVLIVGLVEIPHHAAAPTPAQ
jgi:hypothetical protein